MTETPAALSVKDVHRHYHLGGHDLHVLKGVSLDVAHGERIFLCGASGAGKTTLLYVLGGMEKPTSGEVLVAGKPLYASTGVALGWGTKLIRLTLLAAGLYIAFLSVSLSIRRDPAWAMLVYVVYAIMRFDIAIVEAAIKNACAQVRNKQLGFVFQNYHLLPDLTALENVMLPALIGGRAARDRAKELLGRVGLAERTHHLPTELSGGEQQRVALARSLINDPAIILADEPTGNLDAATGGQIMELLFKVVEEAGKTLVVVTHDQNLAKLGERRMLLKQGVLEAA